MQQHRIIETAIRPDAEYDLGYLEYLRDVIGHPVADYATVRAVAAVVTKGDVEIAVRIVGSARRNEGTQDWSASVEAVSIVVIGGLRGRVLARDMSVAEEGVTTAARGSGKAETAEDAARIAIEAALTADGDHNSFDYEPGITAFDVAEAWMRRSIKLRRRAGRVITKLRRAPRPVDEWIDGEVWSVGLPRHGRIGDIEYPVMRGDKLDSAICLDPDTAEAEVATGKLGKRFRFMVSTATGSRLAA